MASKNAEEVATLELTVERLERSTGACAVNAEWVIEPLPGQVGRRYWFGNEHAAREMCVALNHDAGQEVFHVVARQVERMAL